MEISRTGESLPASPAPQDLGPRRGRRRRDRPARPIAFVPDPRTRRRRIVIALVAAFAVGVPIALWAGYRMSYVYSRNAVVKGSITNVGAQLQGVVTSVEVEAGDHVRSGQILARFEDHQLQASVLRAQSRVVEATARAASARARTFATNSESEYSAERHKRFKALASKGVIAQAELLTSEKERRTTQALERTSIADWRAAEAEAATAQAELDLAKADLDAALIRAPADGRVLRRIAEPGASVVVGQPIIALWIGKEVWVEAWVGEDQLSQIAVGNPAKVTVRSTGDRVLSGVVESIGVSTDSELPETAVPQPRNARIRTTPVVGVRIRLDQSQGLFPGLSAVVGVQKKKPR